MKKSQSYEIKLVKNIAANESLPVISLQSGTIWAWGFLMTRSTPDIMGARQAVPWLGFDLFLLSASFIE